MTIQQNIYSFLSVFLKLEHSTGQVGNANSYHGTQLAVAVSSAFFLIFPHPSMSIEETPITINVTVRLAGEAIGVILPTKKKNYSCTTPAIISGNWQDQLTLYLGEAYELSSTSESSFRGSES